MVFSRLFDMLTSSWLTTAYAFFCVIILCVVFQLAFLKKANKQEGSPLSIRHFVWVYVFLFYLMLVYQVTGMGTVWIVGRYPELIRINEIVLLPFGTFGGSSGIVPYLLNVFMTMPLGFLLPLIWKEFRSVKKVALAGLLLSSAIELSQLLNRRTTTIDDLITNTLGAIIGYLIFKWLHKVFCKNREFKTEIKHRSPILRNEAIIYLICSFVGMFLFFNGFAFSHINFGTSRGDVVIHSNYTKGIVLEVNEDTIKIDKVDIWENADGSTGGANTGIEITVILTEQTTFEIYRTNAAGTIEPVITQTTKDIIGVRDSIDIYGSYEGMDIVADAIIMWKFDG